jgi:hypothetical protein
MPSGEDLARAVVAAARHRLAESAAKIKHCLGQLSDVQLGWRPRESQNSIANLVLHLCGNVRQWIVSGCGGEPDTRDRPGEFAERRLLSRTELERRLDEAVGRADTVLAGLTAGQLLEKRGIQGFDTTVLGAIFDSVPHFNGHTQEIVLLTRLQLGDAYSFQWVPATPEQGAPS